MISGTTEFKIAETLRGLFKESRESKRIGCLADKRGTAKGYVR